MKRLVFLITLLAATMASAGWWETYGDTGDDKGYCVQETSDGNYIVVGQKDLFTLWVFETDTFGNILWEKTYDDGYGRWIEETSDGNYVIAGFPGLYKIDPQGEIIWKKDYGVGGRCVQELPEGGFIVVSLSAYFRTDSNGDTLWMKTIQDPDHWYEFSFVQITQDGGYILVGFQGYLVPEEIDQRWLSLIKTNSQGEVQWIRTYRGSNDGSYFENYGYCAKPTPDSGYIVSGLNDPGGVWLLKTNSLGDTLWTRTYGGGSGHHVQLTSDGGYIITGGTETGTGVFSIKAPQPVSAPWLIKTDSLGDTLWTRIYGATGAGRCVQQTAVPGYLATGNSSGDIFLLRTDTLGNLSVSEKPIVESPTTWQIISSVGRSITIHFFNRPQGFRAVIFDVSGREVDVIDQSTSAGSISWGQSQVPGVYFIRSSETNHARTEKVVIIH